MKKNKIFIVMVLFIMSINSASSQTNHLIPESGIFNAPNFQIEYYSKVRKILFQGMDFRPIIRLVILPSFSPESVLEVEFNRSTNKMYVVYQIAEEMIANNPNWEQTKLKSIKKEITNESAKFIQRLFQAAVAGIKESDDEQITQVGDNYTLTVKHVGVDGENYFFTANVPIPKTGTTWSPPTESKMGRIVNIGLEVINLARNEKEPIEFDSKLKEKMTQLTAELKTAP
jgi:hypothetical protein